MQNYTVRSKLGTQVGTQFNESVATTMAINRKDYSNKIETGLSANNDYTIFLYRFMYEKKEYSGLIDLTDKSAWEKRSDYLLQRGTGSNQK
jgi:hypothetical protein